VRDVNGRVRDPVSLVAGVAICVLGALLILDQTDVIDLTFGWLGAAMAAVLGAILLVSGLMEGQR